MKRFPKSIGHCLTTALLTSAILEAAVLPLVGAASVEAQTLPETDPAATAAATADPAVDPASAVAPPDAALPEAASPAAHPVASPVPIAAPGYAKPSTAAHPKPAPAIDSGIAAANAERSSRLSAARQEVAETLAVIVERHRLSQAEPIQPTSPDAAIAAAVAEATESQVVADPISPEARAELLDRIAAQAGQPQPTATLAEGRPVMLPSSPESSRVLYRRNASGQVTAILPGASCRRLPDPPTDRAAQSATPQLGAQIAVKLVSLAPEPTPPTLRPALTPAEASTIGKAQAKAKQERKADFPAVVEVRAVNPPAIDPFAIPLQAVTSKLVSNHDQSDRPTPNAAGAAWVSEPIVTELTQTLQTASTEPSADARTAQKAKAAPRTTIAAIPAAAGAAAAEVCAKALSAQMTLTSGTRSILARQFSRAGIRFPLPIAATVTSAFGWRIHPITGDRRFHEGVDFGAPMGTPVLAAHSGQVAAASDMGGYGLTVILENGGERNLYAHLSGIAVQPGDRVEQGAVIGWVGSTGNSTGPHLHFETQIQTANGWIAIDPLAAAGAIAQRY